jgi:hypothetical protein
MNNLGCLFTLPVQGNAIVAAAGLRVANAHGCRKVVIGSRLLYQAYSSTPAPVSQDNLNRLAREVPFKTRITVLRRMASDGPYVDVISANIQDYRIVHRSGPGHTAGHVLVRWRTSILGLTGARWWRAVILREGWPRQGKAGCNCGRDCKVFYLHRSIPFFAQCRRLKQCQRRPSGCNFSRGHLLANDSLYPPCVSRKHRRRLVTKKKRIFGMEDSLFFPATGRQGSITCPDVCGYRSHRSYG